MTHTIATTMQPDKPIEVEDAEYLDPTRIPDDPSSYARYSIPGLAIAWVEVPS